MAAKTQVSCSPAVVLKVAALQRKSRKETGRKETLTDLLFSPLFSDLRKKTFKEKD